MGVDEAQDLRPEVWKTVLAPMLMGRNGEALLIGTKKRRNWFREEWKRVYQDNVPQSKAFYYPCTSNSFITAEEWDMEKKRQGPITWDNEFISNPLANDIQDESRKYSEFDRNVHVVEPFAIPDNWKRYRGLDWGMDHPTACVWVARDPKDGTVYQYDEYLRAGPNADAQALTIIQKTLGKEIEASPLDQQCWRRESDGLSVAVRFIKAGLKVIPAKKEDKAGSGASIVKGFLRPATGKPRFKIFNTCVKTIEELEGLEWGDDVADDLSDAVRYVLVFLNQLGIETVQAKNDWYDKNLVRKVPTGPDGSYKFEPVLPPNTDDDINFTDAGYLA